MREERKKDLHLLLGGTLIIASLVTGVVLTAETGRKEEQMFEYMIASPKLPSVASATQKAQKTSWEEEGFAQEPVCQEERIWTPWCGCQEPTYGDDC